MESTFSSPAEAALQLEAGAAGLRTPLGDLDRVYELERVVGFVRDLGCQRVRSGWVAQRIGILGDFVRMGMREDASLGGGTLKVRQGLPEGFP